MTAQHPCPSQCQLRNAAGQALYLPCELSEVHENDGDPLTPHLEDHICTLSPHRGADYKVTWRPLGGRFSEGSVL